MQKAIIIHDFMLNDKNLKGAKLLVYAFIYSYAQIPDAVYSVRWSNACKFLGISKSTYFDSIKWLIGANYITSSFALAYSLRSDPVYLTFSDLQISKDKFNEMVRICQTRWIK